jgi:Flp pilus assembly CpaE family ATPase
MFIYNNNLRLEAQIISVIDLNKKDMRKGDVRYLLFFSAIANGVEISEVEFESKFETAFHKLIKSKIIREIKTNGSDNLYSLNF